MTLGNCNFELRPGQPAISCLYTHAANDEKCVAQFFQDHSIPILIVILSLLPAYILEKRANAVSGWLVLHAMEAFAFSLLENNSLQHLDLDIESLLLYKISTFGEGFIILFFTILSGSFGSPTVVTERACGILVMVIILVTVLLEDDHLEQLKARFGHTIVLK